MILDAVSNGEFYNTLNPRFAKAFAYLKTIDPAAMAEGKYEIDGKEIFMSVVERDLKTPEEAALEVHDKYIDIQIVVAGQESFGWKDRKVCASPRGEISVEKDILFYDDKPSTYFTLQPGEFAIFFPGDAHAPLVGQGRIKKCIIKVLA